MNLEIVFFVMGLVILSIFIYICYNWYVLYARTKGYNLKTLFEAGFFGPEYIKSTDTQFSKNDRKTLNRLLVIFYSLIFCFGLLFILTVIFIKK